jgi:hypothetical protein
MILQWLQVWHLRRPNRLLRQLHRVPHNQQLRRLSRALTIRLPRNRTVAFRLLFLSLRRLRLLIRRSRRQLMWLEPL